jgi:hypothetical protein
MLYAFVCIESGEDWNIFEPGKRYSMATTIPEKDHQKGDRRRLSEHCCDHASRVTTEKLTEKNP